MRHLHAEGVAAQLVAAAAEHAKPGKLDALNARFRDHTLKLFAKHGMTSLGYFVPVDNKENKLVYFLAFPDRAAHDASWKAFGADPEWKAAAKESEKDGKLKRKPPRTPKPIAKGKRMKAEREAKAWAKASRKTT